MQLKVVGTAVALAAVGGAAVIAQADDQGARVAQKGSGGLAISPATIDRPVAAGAVNAMTIANNSGEPLDVTVAARPWTQSSSGRVVPNRRKAISAMDVSEGAFTLAPGAKKTVNVALKSAPSSGYLYGALEVVGLPRDIDKSKGIVTGYRLVGAVRYNPATPVFKLKVGSAKVKAKQLTLTVRNSGNTVEPVSGSVRVKGPMGSRSASIKSTRFLPGKSVSLPLMSASRLSKGTYTATVKLKQGKYNTTVTKRVKVRH